MSQDGITDDHTQAQASGKGDTHSHGVRTLCSSFSNLIASYKALKLPHDLID